MRQSQEDLMWQEAAARQEKQEQRYREEIASLRQRAEAAEARVKELDNMLDMLPEYLEYWDACDAPALSLSEWWVYKDGYQE